MRIATAVLTFRLLPVLALAVVLVLDEITRSFKWGILGTGLLDEPAHVATAVLVLLAVAGPRWLLARLPFTCAALIASVAIDIDHVPLYEGVHVAVDGGRPFTHCLLTAVVLAAAAGVAGRFRPILLGLATGVLLHLLRDLPTGPGVSLFFPVWSTRIEMPYPAYVIVLVVCAVVATLRVGVRRRTPGGTAAQRHATIGP